MLSVFLQMLFGWSLLLSLTVTAVVAISYLFWGGFRSDVETDVLEFFLMFAGFAVILPYCFSRFGGMDFLRLNLPPLHLTWHGGNSMQYIMVWFFIALWTLVDPAFHQRCYASKDGNVAQRGILISIIFWFVFDFMTATAGLYARAALPTLEQPMMAYPMLAELVLPPIAKGMFYVGMLATIMSTLNTLAFVSAQTLGRDIVGRLRLPAGKQKNRGVQDSQSDKVASGVRPGGSSPENSSENLPQGQTEMSKRLTQIGLIVSFLISVALALAVPSVIQLWYSIGTVIIPGLLVPLMASYFDRLRIPAGYAFCAMLFGWLTSLSWLIAGNINGNAGNYPAGIEPMYPGLAVSLVFWVLGRANGRSSEGI
jgi:SSS family solute:Na+ symporter